MVHVNIIQDSITTPLVWTGLHVKQKIGEPFQIFVQHPKDVSYVEVTCTPIRDVLTNSESAIPFVYGKQFPGSDDAGVIDFPKIRLSDQQYHKFLEIDEDLPQSMQLVYFASTHQQHKFPDTPFYIRCFNIETYVAANYCKSYTGSVIGMIQYIDKKIITILS